ncbi:MAG: Lon protease family protein [Gammaproteobacteria bacterium]
MDAHEPLGADQLYRRCPPELLPFETTADLEGANALYGQERALEAIAFGVDMKQDGHNLFVMGPPGTGRRSFLTSYLAEVATREPAPSDWCYVNDFERRERPRALELPAGAGPRLANHIDTFIEEVQAAIAAAFNSQDYRARRQAIEHEFQEAQSEAFERVQAEAAKRDIRVMQTPGGMVFAPLVDGEVLGPQEFEKLPAERQQGIQQAVEEVGKLFQDSMREMPERLRRSRERLRELDREVAEFAIERLVGDLRQTWHALPAVAAWIDTLHADLSDNYELLQAGNGEDTPLAQLESEHDELPRSRARRRYGVNVLVSNADRGGAPVVVEQRPAYVRLFGKIEHRAQFGALLTDFHMIRAGALHEANGGYLLINAERLVMEPFAWDALKECLRTGTVRIRPLDEVYGLMSAASIEPEPIPLSVKVVLVGSPRLHYLLSSLDPEFDDFFKVVAEFDDRAERSPEVAGRFAELLAGLTREDGLLPFERDAVARLFEEASREAEDAERVSTEIRRSVDLAREASHWAHRRGDEIVRLDDVVHTVEIKAHRRGRLRERVLEEIERDTVLIDTAGARVGQINGLAVLAAGDQAFGRPSRITARVGLGHGRIIDIEREAELGGALHTKGVMILAGYINARYADGVPASFAATLAFEQSYGGIDGDSASSAELYALLSALAEVPLRQDLAVTGSVNQFGTIQAIGGVNHKIEGFFDVCAQRGLSGSQGVLIPQANVKHLMLRQRVVDAVRQGRFHVYAVETIEQGLEILTGLEAGVPDDAGAFPADSVHARVAARLRRFAEQRRAFAGSGNGDGDDRHEQ